MNMHVISKSMALRVPGASFLVLTKAHNSNILEVKETPPHLKHVLLRKKLRTTNLIHNPLYGLKK